MLIGPLDSLRARIQPANARRGPNPARRGGGGFLDLRTLTSALTGESHSLESACSRFGVEFHKQKLGHGTVTTAHVDYCRADVEATTALYQALAGEYERWGLALAPTRAYSSASLAKAYLREARIEPLLSRQPDFPPDVLGYAMVAYYGGRAEGRIRRVPVPVVYLDFASMYPTICAPMGMWQFHAGSEVDVVENDPAETEAWLRGLSREDAFDPALWPRLSGFALIEPDGDPLPVRARYARGGAYGIGVNPLTSKEPSGTRSPTFSPPPSNEDGR